MGRQHPNANVSVDSAAGTISLLRHTCQCFLVVRYSFKTYILLQLSNDLIDNLICLNFGSIESVVVYCSHILCDQYSQV